MEQQCSPPTIIFLSSLEHDTLVRTTPSSQSDSPLTTSAPSANQTQRSVPPSNYVHITLAEWVLVSLRQQSFYQALISHRTLTDVLHVIYLIHSPLKCIFFFISKVSCFVNVAYAWMLQHWTTLVHSDIDIGYQYRYSILNIPHNIEQRCYIWIV